MSSEIKVGGPHQYGMRGNARFRDVHKLGNSGV